MMKTLAEILNDESMKMIDYCIIGNHLYLLIKAEKNNMISFMKKADKLLKSIY